MYKATIFLCCCCVVCCYSSPFNGEFEFHNSNNIPIGWDYFNEVLSETILLPDISTGGAPWHWRIDHDIGLSPFAGDRMLTLTTSANDELVSSAWRVISVQGGQVIKGMFWIGTCDYFPYNDWFTIILYPVDSVLNDEIVIFRYEVSDIGDYSSLGAWMRFQYAFTEEQAGDYILTIYTSDFGDAIYSSQMALDRVTICWDVTGEADLNCDCVVDLNDLAVVLNDWMIMCLDQYADCLGGTDLNGDGIVDGGDLFEMNKYWLKGEKVNHNLRCDVDTDDGLVNLRDFAAYAAKQGQANAEHDYDNSGVVDKADLTIFCTEYLR